MTDCLILGGGVIGLSLAYELAGQGVRVRLVDRTQPGTEASWAGAGILPPSSAHSGASPYEQLSALSLELHRQWAAELRESTGVDNGYRRCGAIYVADAPTAVDQLTQQADAWRAQHIACETPDKSQLARLEPALRLPRLAVHVPDECQLRNPRHLRALLVACGRRGVVIDAGIEAHGWLRGGSRIVGVQTSAGLLTADRYCVTAGAWTRGLLSDVASCQLRPIRGQIVLLNDPRSTLRHIINDGPRYLVPRGDGRILVGSTEEDVGFDKRNTATAVADLLALAHAWVPDLSGAHVERCWAGLRPATPDRLPLLGRVADLENLFVAAGHFRSGLTLSTGTARVVGQLIRDQRPSIDLAPFSPARES